MTDDSKSDDQRRDEILRRMLNTPPKPKAGKPKKATDKKPEGKDSDGVAEPRGKAKQSK